MSSAPTLPRRPLPFGLLWAVGLLWAWYCHHWPYLQTANEAMRLYFVQAVVETGRPELDGVVARHRATPVDRSEYAGHVYMDKAPGASLLALPLYPPLRAVLPDVHDEGLWKFGYLATLATMVAPLLLALYALARYLATLGLAPRSVALTVVALATASPLLVYASLFFGHALAAAAVAFGFFVVAASDGRPSRRAGLWAGAALAVAGLTDTPVFVLAAGVALYAGLRSEPLPGAGQGWRAWNVAGRLRATWPIWGGLAAGVALQLVYNQWVLGHPLRFTYQFKGDQQLKAIMDTGFLGFRPPQADALVGLLLSARRGLFYHAPWLAAAAVALGWRAASPAVASGPRLDAVAALGLAGGYTLFVSGFADWPAGDCAGPRHLLPVVPLLGWGLAIALEAPLKWWLRAGLWAALGLAVVLHVPTVATFPYHFAQLERPVLELGVPLLIQRAFSPSIGQWLGLPAVASFVVFLIAIVWLWIAVLRLPKLDRSAGVPRWRSWGATVAFLVVWTVGITSVVPERPGRAAEVGRYRASVMLKQGTQGRPHLRK
ncbi:MAG: hypothetical protein HY902_09630 [Deltaproteobacteria bacterium]|nr:hypothetical protein [Deltaproteobacteria bacterium]